MLRTARLLTAAPLPDMPELKSLEEKRKALKAQMESLKAEYDALRNESWSKEKEGIKAYGEQKRPELKSLVDSVGLKIEDSFTNVSMSTIGFEVIIPGAHGAVKPTVTVGYQLRKDVFYVGTWYSNDPSSGEKNWEETNTGKKSSTFLAYLEKVKKVGQAAVAAGFTESPKE